MKRENLHLGQIQTDVSLLSFMAAAVIFFTGLIITRYDSFDAFIKVPISFLIISIFGFLYPALILANSSQELIDGKKEKFQKHVTLGYVISEYLGIYLLVLSIPLIINIITTDVYLRTVTLFSSLIGFAFYQFMHVSILETHLPKQYKMLSWTILGFGLALFFSQIYEFYFVPLAIIFLIFIVSVSYAAIKANYKNIEGGK